MPDAVPPTPVGELPRAGIQVPALSKAMIGVMRRVREVPKVGWNKEAKFDFIAAGDVLASVQNALVSEGLWLSQREVGRTIVNKILFIKYELDIYHESGEAIFNAASHTGACRFEFKSGTTDDRSANKAYTAAEKRMLLGIFKIPADDHHTERASDGDPDGQGENDEPDDRPDRPDRPNDRGNGQDARGQHQRQLEEPRRDPEPPPPAWETPDPRWDNPAPPQDVFAGSNVDTSPPRDPAEQDHRQQVVALHKKLRAATNETDAVALWKDGQDILQACNDATYDWLRDDFEGRWHRNPPRID